MYTVSVLNQPVSGPKTLSQALRAASQAVYASPSTLEKAEKALREGREATWVYGFTSVSITPVVQDQPLPA